MWAARKAGCSWAVAIGCVLLLFSSCATRQGRDYSRPAVSVFVTRDENAQPHRPVPQNPFNNHDRIAVVVRNLMPGEQVLMVEVLRSDSGVVVWRNSLAAPSGRTLAMGTAFSRRRRSGRDY